MKEALAEPGWRVPPARRCPPAPACLGLGRGLLSCSFRVPRIRVRSGLARLCGRAQCRRVAPVAAGALQRQNAGAWQGHCGWEDHAVREPGQSLAVTGSLPSVDVHAHVQAVSTTQGVCTHPRPSCGRHTHDLHACAHGIGVHVRPAYLRRSHTGCVTCGCVALCVCVCRGNVCLTLGHSARVCHPVARVGVVPVVSTCVTQAEVWHLCGPSPSEKLLWWPLHPILSGSSGHLPARVCLLTLALACGAVLARVCARASLLAPQTAPGGQKKSWGVSSALGQLGLGFPQH